MRPIPWDAPANRLPVEACEAPIVYALWGKGAEVEEVNGVRRMYSTRDWRGCLSEMRGDPFEKEGPFGSLQGQGCIRTGLFMKYKCRLTVSAEIGILRSTGCVVDMASHLELKGIELS